MSARADRGRPRPDEARRVARALLAASALVSLAGSASPQAVERFDYLDRGRRGAQQERTDWSGSRYELGRRLRAFERAYAGAGEEARAAAVLPLQAAVSSYFRADAGAAARALDAARRAVAGGNAAAAWADALVLEPSTRCLAPDARRLLVRVRPLYELDGIERPAGELRLRLELVTADERALGRIEASLGALPAELAMPLDGDGMPEGDHLLRAEVVGDEHALARQEQTVSVVRQARPRLEAVNALVAARTGAPTLEVASLRGLFVLLRPLCDGGSAETDVPIARLLAEAEAMAACVERDEPWLDPTRAGDHWLRVPVGDALVPVRLLVPGGLDDGEPQPLVVGLHGAGGSESMFFEAYGDGLAPRLAAERGWLFVSARAGFLSLPPVVELVDALAARLPIDRRRVALVGHSMGAMHATRLLSDAAGRFAAAALLSGGGPVRPSDPLETLPLWVGAGEQDFGLSASRKLAELLREAGCERVELRVVPQVEHLAVVQAALPEVFAFLDRALAPR